MIELIDVREKARTRYALYEETVLKALENGKKEFENKDFYIFLVEE